MKAIPFLVSTLLVAVALAGCTESGPGSSDDSTTTTTTPPTTTTTTTPPTQSEGNDSESPPAPLDCSEPPATDAEAGDVMGYPELVFTVEEPEEDGGCFGFVGPASATAGWNAVTLRNNGMQPHIMPMYFIGERTLDEVKAALGAGEEPEWLEGAGGVGFATPFSSGTAILDLKPGNYLVICFFNGHHMQGMYRLLTVTEAEDNATVLPEPTANLTVVMDDFSFTLPNATAGRHVVKFVNNGTQPHEAPLVKLQGNATMQDFLAAIETPGPTPPPGSGVGGVNVVAPGGHAYAVVDFESGATYGLVCFVEDHESERPHVALGMVAQFTVE